MPEKEYLDYDGPTKHILINSELAQRIIKHQRRLESMRKKEVKITETNLKPRKLTDEEKERVREAIEKEGRVSAPIVRECEESERGVPKYRPR